MRFVARLAIAIATLLTSAILCWGQPPMGMPARKLAAPASQAASHDVAFEGEPSADGTWIADDGYEGDDPGYAEGYDGGYGEGYAPGYDQGMMHAPEELGVYGDGAYEGLPMEMGCDCDDCRAAAGYDPAAGGGRHGGKRHVGLFAPLWCSDLWNEVHAHRRVYVQADYLSFWTKGNPLPPLVTTSPLGTPQSQAGRLPVSATTSILFGGDRVDLDQRNGGRINVGYWLIDGEFLGIEGQYFALEEQNTLFNANSNFTGDDPTAQILARPFLNVDPLLLTPTEDAAIVAFPNGFVLGALGPGTLDGGIDIRTTSNLQSAGGLFRKLFWIDFTMQRRLDLLLGYRFLRLDDSVTINDRSSFLPDGGISTIDFFSQDQFSASNQFHGGEIGLKFQSHHGRLSIDLVGKCAFGNNRQCTSINGYNTITADEVTVQNVGGLLAQPTNIGSYTRDVFAVLPEANANLRWDITCNLRGTLGYTFLYLNRVQRSGDAINTTLNPTQINGGTLVGEAQPAFSSTDSTYWAHGVSGGIEYRW